MFTKTPGESEEGPEGERFELTCEVSGRPVPKVNWFQLVTPVSELGDPSIRDHENGSLVFERLQFNHSGIYICKVVGFEAVSDRTELQVVVKENEFRVGELGVKNNLIVIKLSLSLFSSSLLLLPLPSSLSLSLPLPSPLRLPQQK